MLEGERILDAGFRGSAVSPMSAGRGDSMPLPSRGEVSATLELLRSALCLLLNLALGVRLG